MKKIEIKPEEKIPYEKNYHSQEKMKKVTRNKFGRRDKNIKTLKSFFPSAKSLLCVGARDDSEVKQFIDAGYDALGIDINGNSKYIKEVDAHRMSEYFKDRKFDLIYSSHSLEHMYDPEKALEEFRKISKMGCFIILPLTIKDPKLKEPSLNHPVVFDIQLANFKDIEELNKNMNVINKDFEKFINYKIVHYHRRIIKNIPNEIEICFKWK